MAFCIWRTRLWLLLALSLCLSSSMGFQTLSIKSPVQRSGHLASNYIFSGYGARVRTLKVRRVETSSLNMDMSVAKRQVATDRVNSASDYSMGFSFSVAGLLFPYHLGVADYLKEKQLITQGTPLSGSSGGALAAALTALSFSGLDIEDVLDTTQTAYTELRSSSMKSVQAHFVNRMAPAQEIRQVCAGSPWSNAHNRA
jgi:hypothetical protein